MRLKDKDFSFQVGFNIGFGSWINISLFELSIYHKAKQKIFHLFSIFFLHFSYAAACTLRFLELEEILEWQLYHNKKVWLLVPSFCSNSVYEIGQVT